MQLYVPYTMIDCQKNFGYTAIILMIYTFTPVLFPILDRVGFIFIINSNTIITIVNKAK